MDNLYLVFQDQISANNGLETMYANMVGRLESEYLLDVTNGQIYDKDSLTDEQKAQFGMDNRRFPVFGENAASGIKDTTTGYTVAWAVAQQTKQGQWVCPKPDDALLANVTGYVVEPYNPAWFDA